MKYKLVQRANPLNRDQMKWYATPVYDGKITMTDVAREIVNLSSLSRGDVSNVVSCFIDIIPKYLVSGKSVVIDGLGTFRLSFSSEGLEDPDSFVVGMIQGKKIIFTPSVELKDAIAKIHFEKA